jgi:hypothetical protein
MKCCGYALQTAGCVDYGFTIEVISAMKVVKNLTVLIYKVDIN